MVAAEIHPADEGDTTTLEGTLDAAAEGLEAAGTPPTADTPADLVADKGYHSRAVLKDLDGGPWRSRIAEPKPKDVLRWHGDLEAQWAVYGNRARIRSGVAKEALKLRAERSFEHTLDRGDLRRAHLRGRANLQKRYLIHVAGFNLGLVMRLVLGAGTPKELAARRGLLFWSIHPTTDLVAILILPSEARASGTSASDHPFATFINGLLGRADEPAVRAAQATGPSLISGRLSQLLPAATMQLSPAGEVLTTVHVPVSLDA
ncbi:MAG TPA: hypothetical protein VFZ10_05450 [Geminicoccaceae bacterium]